MADDDAQGPELTSWWTTDALDDSSLPTTTFDEPLVWPESASWGEPEGADALVVLPGDEPGQASTPPPEAADGPDSDARWRASETAPGPDPEATVQHRGPLDGLGGGGGGRPRSAPNVGDDLPWPAVAGAATGSPAGGTARSPELGSIWSNDFRSDPEDLVGFAGLPAPAIYADTERGHGRRGRRFDIRTGNAAVIGLISVVSLVLLGMFLTVRARNDTPTDTSQARPAGDEIAVTGPLNTVPLTTTVTSTTLVPGINIAGLLPPPESTGDAAGAGTGAGTGAGSGSGTSTATTVPARTAAPTGGGTATTTATTRPTATTAPSPPAAPDVTEPPDTSPPATAPPVEDTTPTTQRPTPTFTVPTFTIPSIPGGTAPRFPMPTIRDDD